MDLVGRIRVVAARVAASHGLDIFDVQYRREGRGMVLRVWLDRPGAGGSEQDSVGVDDCVVVSRDLSAVLDVDDLIPAAYTLEVSSPGLDRPLRGEDDYRRFIGRRAKMVMREAVDGQGYFKGRLAGLEAGDEGPVVVIDADDGRRHLVPLRVVTRANLEVEF